MDTLYEVMKLLGIIIAAVLSYLSQRKAGQANTKIDTVGTAVNGRLSQLVEVVHEKGVLLGRLQGAAQEQARSAVLTSVDKPPPPLPPPPPPHPAG